MEAAYLRLSSSEKARQSDFRRPVSARSFFSAPTLLRFVLRYIHFLLTQYAQTAFANANYGVEPRLARSLQMVQDRLETDELHLTHTVLSFMLGTRRASVTDATHILEGCHLIRASRGTITVRDRKGSWR
jgi:CRP-like cAMP-binding protein